MRLQNLCVLALAATVLFMGPTLPGKAQGGMDSGGHRHHRVPDWLVGHFKGHNRKYKVETELTIRPDGTVKSFARFRNGKRSKDSGVFRDHTIQMSSGSYLVQKTSDGFRLIQTTDPSNVATYHAI